MGVSTPAEQNFIILFHTKTSSGILYLDLWTSETWSMLPSAGDELTLQTVSLLSRQLMPQGQKRK